MLYIQLSQALTVFISNTSMRSKLLGSAYVVFCILWGENAQHSICTGITSSKDPNIGATSKTVAQPSADI